MDGHSGRVGGRPEVKRRLEAGMLDVSFLGG